MIYFTSFLSNLQSQLSLWISVFIYLSIPSFSTYILFDHPSSLVHPFLSLYRSIITSVLPCSQIYHRTYSFLSQPIHSHLSFTLILFNIQIFIQVYPPRIQISPFYIFLCNPQLHKTLWIPFYLQTYPSISFSNFCLPTPILLYPFTIFLSIIYRCPISIWIVYPLLFFYNM